MNRAAQSFVGNHDFRYFCKVRDPYACMHKRTYIQVDSNGNVRTFERRVIAFRVNAITADHKHTTIMYAVLGAYILCIDTNKLLFQHRSKASTLRNNNHGTGLPLPSGMVWYGMVWYGVIHSI